MNLKIQIRLATAVFMALGAVLIAVSIFYLTGGPRVAAVIAGACGTAAGVLLLGKLAGSIQAGITRLGGIARDVAEGSLSPADGLDGLNGGRGEFAGLARSFQSIAADLYHKTEEERLLRLKAEEQAWINDRVSELALRMQGTVHLQEASRLFVAGLASAVGASFGALYVLEGGAARFSAGYAYDEEALSGQAFRLGSGLVGQCALDGQPVYLEGLPSDYFRIRSGLGETLPKALLLMPIRHEDRIMAVAELALTGSLRERERRFAERAGANMGTLINTLSDVARIDSLLKETSLQKEELEAQTEELQAQTQELRAQTEELEAQKEEIEAQAEELRAQTEELLESNLELKREQERTEAQKREIETQAEELRVQAEELKLQAEKLLESNEGLKREKEQTEAQKFEIAAQADELAAQTEELRAQSEELLESNRKLKHEKEHTEAQKLEIQAQAEEIRMAAQYKSEFLANVSHELRTPLNSLLILSQILAENREGNLGTKQLEYVHTIFSAGKDLLQLIDEILDLAKLEVGKMAAVLEPVRLSDVRLQMLRHFEQQAKKKGLRFEAQSDSRLPEWLMTDGHRLQQILNNLLTNALKFTEQGAVTLSVRLSGEEVIFAVSDTGIGIPADKLGHIFEAFQQADGTTSRRYGGTGLGLTICRELASLLGGRIEVETAEGKGSTFSLHLPAAEPPEGVSLVAAASELPPLPEAGPADERANPGFRESFVPDISIANPKLLQYSDLDDDRNDLEPGDHVLLIIEDDSEFAGILLRLARQRGFKAIVAFQGDQGLALAHAYKPDSIVLDLHLPVLDGWSIISRLKSRPDLRHIPVHVISTTDENQQSLAMGALGFWKKPGDQNELEAAFLQIETYIRRRVKNLLIVEDNADLRKSLVEFIESPDVRVIAAGTGREALERLGALHFDCMVLDLGLADISGFDLLEQIKTNRKLQTLPVIIYTGKELTKTDEQRIRHYAENIVIKNVKSIERLYDETALYLHRRLRDLPPDKQQLIEKLHNPEAAFAGKRIMLVDDDMRNIFALSSVLEGYNMDIRFAQNGKEALALLESEGPVELMFMDIMMPEMDGYETMQRIRQMSEYDGLVMIALTARAMEEDRLKCLKAGASDYISKPINTTQLVTVLKAWLIR
ncbi:response regulator [Paenibacillus glufosinatiresistens]|uniref:response regulator n=1 Tax=Paenibacillus glufosinatiresistens TaxID=3070657 RepID=UPI00286D7779|nr:response regulator [Paenibacillus sp. YX.27]